MGGMIMEIARAHHRAACEAFDDGLDDPRLARPFGTPHDMPPHVWRVSWDVMQALYNASPPPVGPNPKNGDDGTRRLFGWRIERDLDAPPGTLELHPAV